MKRTIRAAEDNSSGTPFTPGVEVGGFIFISGQICQVFNTVTLRKENVAEETKQVMENLGAVLKGAGLGYEHLVKCTIYMTNLQHYAELNRIYLSYFTAGDPPARETVGVKDLPRGVNVMISAIATRG
ncbi:MAG: RidA family protein [Flavobacteriales bacterium]|nr:RidA family protein [Flavobacteriales bacterium]